MFFNEQLNFLEMSHAIFLLFSKNSISAFSVNYEKEKHMFSNISFSHQNEILSYSFHNLYIYIYYIGFTFIYFMFIYIYIYIYIYFIFSYIVEGNTTYLLTKTQTFYY